MTTSLAAEPSAAKRAAATNRVAVEEKLRSVEIGAFLDGVIGDAMATDHIAGMAVSIVYDGKIVYMRGYGIASLSPTRSVDPVSTLFRVGSLTKTLTWLAVMKEVERGRIDLHAPVNRYLPSHLQILNQGFVRPVRMIDLMSHSAGFGDSELGHMFVEKPARLISLDAYLTRHPPMRVREAGKISSYSNHGAVLAGYILARLNGTTYQQVIEREITGPLGLQHFSIREPYPPRLGLPSPMTPLQASNLSSGFVFTGADFSPQPIEYLGNTAPAGVASMSAANAALYMRLLLAEGTLDGVRIYGKSVADAIRRPIMNVAPGVNGWAHGFVATALPGGLTGFGHSGATQFFFTNMMVIPELKLGIFVSANTNTGWSISQRLPRLVVERLLADRRTPINRPGSLDLARRSLDYDGTFLMTRRPHAGLEKFVDLLGGASTVAVTADGYLVTHYGPLVQSWVPDGRKGGFVKATGDEKLTFMLDSKGRATGFPLPSGNSWLLRSSSIFDSSTFEKAGLITLLISILLWLDTFFGRRPATSPNAWQKRSLHMQRAAAGLWILAAIAYSYWRPELSGPQIMYDFPGLRLRTASSLAALATIFSSLAMLLIPSLWFASADGWPWQRRVLHSVIPLPQAGFGVLLLLWGALNPFA